MFTRKALAFRTREDDHEHKRKDRGQEHPS
jgi:hypothetical protein